MTNTTTEITWSIDEEIFGLDSKYDAIDSLWQSHWSCNAYPHYMDLLGMKVYFGESWKPCASDFIDVDRIIEDMGERAYDNHGEWAEDFPDVDKKAIKLLENYLKKWADKYCDVSFYSVNNVKEHVITEEDLREFFLSEETINENN